MITLNLLLRLLFAHLVMDFVLQTNKMVKGKTMGKPASRAKYNLMHSALHAVAAYVVVADWTNWIIPLTILVTHFLIDFFYKKDKKGLQSFLIDQGLHLLVLVALWICLWGQWMEVQMAMSRLADSDGIWLMIIAYILMLKPASVLISGFIDKWGNQLKKPDNHVINMEEKGLKDAGLWIGYMERILIVTFVFIHCLEAIGFLLAAKSIFRYGDLKELKDIKMTEYVLIGTLASFSIAIVVAMIFKQLAVSIC